MGWCGFWVVCGFIAFGITYHYFQNKYLTICMFVEKDDYLFAKQHGYAGPFGLAVAIVNIYKDKSSARPPFRIRLRRYKYDKYGKRMN